MNRWELNKMKKIVLSLVCGILILGIATGCGNSSLGGSGNVNTIDNEINYFEISNKKIYITKDLEEFVMQLKGLGCNLSAEYTNLTGQLEIDDINSKDNKFYSLESQGSGQIVNIECPGEQSYDSITMSLFLEMTEQPDGTDQNLGLYVDRPIRTWSISSSNRNAKVGGSKGTLLLGDDPSSSNINDIEKLFGKNYEYDTDRHDRIEEIEYENEGQAYSYDLRVKYASNSDNTGQRITYFSITENDYWRS